MLCISRNQVDGFTSPLTPLQPHPWLQITVLLAGEGSIKERGLRPLSKSLPFTKGRGGQPLSKIFPPLQTKYSKAFSNAQFGEGDKVG